MSEQVESIHSITSASPQDDYGPGRDDGSAQRRTPLPAPAAPAAASAGAAAAWQPTSADIQEALQRINEHLAAVDRVIQLQVDARTGITIATVLNSSTGEVLQQFPAESSIHLARMLAGWSHGGNVLFDLIA